jgi:ABC-type phosphate transport system substrate-binding protein
MYQYLKIILTLLVILNYFTISAQERKVVVIVHPENKYKFDSDKKIREIFLLKQKYNHTDYALPVNKSEKSPEAITFYKQILNLSWSQVKKHFFYKLYAEAIHPPIVLESDESVISYIVANKNGIGYVSLSAINSDNSEKVKVVCIIDSAKLSFY